MKCIRNGALSSFIYKKRARLYRLQRIGTNTMSKTFRLKGVEMTNILSVNTI